MINVNSSFEQTLINDFGNLDKVKKILQKGEIYRFSSYSISQQSQLFSQKKLDVLSDSHVKKHYNKLLDMIFLELGDERSKIFFNRFFTPITSSGNWELRKELISNILDVS